MPARSHPLPRTYRVGKLACAFLTCHLYAAVHDEPRHWDLPDLHPSNLGHSANHAESRQVALCNLTCAYGVKR